jgi:hypothetical protein
MPNVLPFALVAVAALFAAPHGPAAVPTRTAEQVRVASHLDGALALLASRDLSALTPTQRANRARAVEVLKVYRDAGAYPVNRDYPGQLVPYFVDPVTDVHCAVGHLMAATGQQALVRRIAAADNHVRVMDLADDVEVRAWLETHGLTLEEAARIQPAYGGWPTPEPPEPRISDTQLNVTLGAALGVSAMHLLSMRREAQPGPALATLAVGRIAVGTGLYASDRNGTRAATALVGATAAVMGARSYRMTTAAGRKKAAAREAELARSNFEWGFAPGLDGRSVGFAARLRF